MPVRRASEAATAVAKSLQNAKQATGALHPPAQRCLGWTSGTINPAYTWTAVLHSDDAEAGVQAANQQAARSASPCMLHHAAQARMLKVSRLCMADNIGLRAICCVTVHAHKWPAPYGDVPYCMTTSRTLQSNPDHHTNCPQQMTAHLAPPCCR